MHWCSDMSKNAGFIESLRLGRLGFEGKRSDPNEQLIVGMHPFRIPHTWTRTNGIGEQDPPEPRIKANTPDAKNLPKTSSPPFVDRLGYEHVESPVSFNWCQDISTIPVRNE